MREVVLLVVAAACGRIGFDARGGDGDAHPPQDAPTTRVLGGQLFGGTGAIGFCDLAVDAAGNIHVVADMEAPADLGGGTLPLRAETDAVFASFAPDLSHRWSFALGGDATTTCTDVAVSGDSVFVQAVFEGSFTRDSNTVTSAGQDDSMVGELDADTGTARWMRALGGPGDDDFGGAVAVSPAGTAVATFACMGTINFDGMPSPGQGDRDVCTVSLAANGAVIEVDRRGGPALDGPRAIVIAPDGTRYVGGVYGAGADFGEGPVASEGGDDIFVLAIEPSGGTRWVRTFGSPGTDGVAALAIGPDGEVYIAGYAQGAIDVGGGVQSGGGYYDALLARFDADGTYRWSHVFGGSDLDELLGVAVRGDALYVAGVFSTGAVIAGQSRTTAGDIDPLIARLTLDGAWQWLHPVGGPDSDYATEIVVAPDGSLWVGGYAFGPIDLGAGAGEQTPGGTYNGFLLHLDDP